VEGEQQDSDGDAKEIRPNHLYGMLLSLKPTLCPNLHKFLFHSKFHAVMYMSRVFSRQRNIYTLINDIGCQQK
jgi:hypothetical protein